MSSKEYLQRLDTPFVPPTHSLAKLHAAVPKRLYHKSTITSLGYICRDVGLALAFFWAAAHIDNALEDSFIRISKYLALEGIPSESVRVGDTTDSHFPLGIIKVLVPTHRFPPIALLKVGKHTIKWTIWSIYWVLQSLVWTGMWCLGHEAGHGTLFSHPYVNDLVGFILHTALLVPYYSWRATHHAHHKATSSVERDENYVPYTRSSLKLPPGTLARVSDYHEIFEETPLYTLLRMATMQILGWQAYLWFNALGAPMYPPGTNHFNPYSKLFKPEQRSHVYLSNVGLAAMITLLITLFYPRGVAVFLNFWFIPYLLMNHWIVMITFLQHTDPSIPHYRKDEWTFLRGASATVDRPLLGWFGRFFLHNASHNHVAHHYFPMIPFYNQPLVTEAIKPILGHSYNYDSTNAFYALYRSFVECQFIEDDDPIAFYKNKAGHPQRSLAPGVLKIDNQAAVRDGVRPKEE